MSNFTASFRRYTKRSFSKEELDLIEQFERQRHSTGRVRAVIDSTPGKFTAVLHAYIAYIQHLTCRDAIVVRCGTGVRPDYRAVSATPRSYIRILATRRIVWRDRFQRSHPLHIQHGDKTYIYILDKAQGMPSSRMPECGGSASGGLAVGTA